MTSPTRRGEVGASRSDRESRGQSAVIGVALLVAITMVALGTMAASVGSVVDDAATDADVRRVTADFDRVLRPVETTGLTRGRVQFGSGSLRTTDRTVRILDADGVVEVHDATALVYTPGPGADRERGGRRVTFLAGSILVTQGDYTRVVRPPPVAAGPGVLVLGLPVVQGNVGVGGRRLDLVVETRVTHTRRTLGNGTWRVAVETTTPNAWNRTFNETGGTPTALQDFDGDGTPSVVVAYPGQRRAHLVLHEVSLEVKQ